ncbi:hypothetical protein SISNIDRAFT_392411, partial [Sistotremastrum niveocremeum HHB9708]
ELGDKSAIIGHTWLYRHNPEIDWQTGKVVFSQCPPHCGVNQKLVKRKKATALRQGKLFIMDELEKEEITDTDHLDLSAEE